MRMRRRFKMASSSKGVPVPPIYESSYSVMDDDLSPSLHLFDLGRKCICFSYIELAWLEEER